MIGPILRTAAVILAVLALTLVGCAGNPPRQAADGWLTQSTGVLDDLQAHQPKDKGRDQGPKVTNNQQAADGQSPNAAALATKSDPSPAQLPTREPAHVMRIWIAPWEDTAGNLRGASHVFTETAPRRWQLASAPGAPAATVLTPFQLEPRKAPEPDRRPTP